MHLRCVAISPLLKDVHIRLNFPAATVTYPKGDASKIIIRSKTGEEIITDRIIIAVPLTVLQVRCTQLWTALTRMYIDDIFSLFVCCYGHFYLYYYTDIINDSFLCSAT